MIRDDFKSVALEATNSSDTLLDELGRLLGRLKYLLPLVHHPESDNGIDGDFDHTLSEVRYKLLSAVSDGRAIEASAYTVAHHNGDGDPILSVHVKFIHLGHGHRHLVVSEARD